MRYRFRKKEYYVMNLASRIYCFIDDTYLSNMRAIVWADKKQKIPKKKLIVLALKEVIDKLESEDNE